MSSTKAVSFSPPTPQQVRDWLESHPARSPSPWVSAWPWAVVVAGVVLASLSPGPGLSLLPWLALAGALGWFSWQRRQQAQLVAQAQDVRAMALMRQDVQALREAWRLLPRLTHVPPMFGGNVFVLAECLDRLGCYEQAIVAYDHLIDRLPEKGPDAATLQLRRAMAELQCERLLDADNTLRRLRGPVESGMYPQPIPALYRLAELMQQVHTHHYAEAVRGAPRLIRQLRPLGVSAGFGFALVALACRMLDDHAVDCHDAPEAAVRWWKRATLLVPAARLVERFPSLAVLSEAGHE